jgi:hypothetical protein
LIDDIRLAVHRGEGFDAAAQRTLDQYADMPIEVLRAVGATEFPRSIRLVPEFGGAA